MAAAKKHECLQEGCKLPQNNNRFLWQEAYIIIGLAILLVKEEAFTFFQVFLFVSPIFLDISYSPLDSKILQGLRFVFAGLNVLIMLICALGMAGIMSDNGSFFSMELAVIRWHIELPKATVAKLMYPNLIVPFVYYGTSPCQHGAKITMLCRAYFRKAEVE